MAQAHGEPVAGDDAGSAGVFQLDALPALAFDHDRILEDYRAWREAGGTCAASGDRAD